MDSAVVSAAPSLETNQRVWRLAVNAACAE